MLNANSIRAVLNRGFIRLIDCMPTKIPCNAKDLKCDYAVVQAARVSYGNATKTIEADKKLIDYLYKHSHTSPFEMVKFKFHVRAPIFVARQWFRHRMSNYNEISGRYTSLEENLYIPAKISSQSTINKQLSANDDLSNDILIKKTFDEYMDNAQRQYELYQKLIKLKVARETARIALPLNMYTEFYWCIDLHNLLNFIRLRSASNAQLEIRNYSEAIEDIIQEYCPLTMESYYKNKRLTLNKDQLKSLDIHPYIYSKLSDREKSELISLGLGM